MSLKVSISPGIMHLTNKEKAKPQPQEETGTIPANPAADNTSKQPKVSSEWCPKQHPTEDLDQTFL